MIVIGTVVAALVPAAAASPSHLYSLQNATACLKTSP
jgi:hypothetical protein